MATEAIKTEATKGRPEPAYRKPTQTRAGRLRQQMIADFVAKLGGADAISALQLRDVERAADLEMLCTTARAAALRGEESLGNVTRLEIQASKAVRRLNLPAPDPSKVSKRYGRPESVPIITDYLAERQAEDE